MLTLIGRSRRSGMRVWTAALLTVVTTAVLTSTAIAAGAATDTSPRFKPVAGKPATQSRPLSMQGNDVVKMVVRLQAESVAEARARSATTLSADEEHAVAATAHRDHVAVHPGIEALGGRVVAEYHHALNGVAVMIPRSQVASLASLPGVKSVHRVNTYKVSNAVSAPYLDLPTVWQGHPSLKGQGIKIAIIDTGIDYTHANFGGPGTPAAYAAAAATSAAPADPALFGPNAPKVKGGIDLAGDAYNADDPNTVAVPDPNPLDCGAHGSHVAGTAAGFGVANGTTYQGPYNAAAYTATQFDIGPGMAPKADLYAVRVFGCSGTTNLVTDAIDWAVQNHMDVISMSLGSVFGTADSADGVATDNAVKAGITVVAAAGNEGPGLYIAGTPASGDHVIAAAAMDARTFYPNGVAVTLSSGAVANALLDNSLPLPGGSVPTVVLTAGAGLSLGCNASDYPSGGAAGALVVVSRGSCTFLTKMANAEAAGAVAIAIVNNRAGYIGNPAIAGATIPFIDVLQSDASKFLTAGAPLTASISKASLPNPGFETLASFTSGGPRFGDSALVPSTTAPGVAVISTAMGTGNQGVAFSGTSMATPHVSAIAALTREAHPRWNQKAITAAIVQTSNPGKLTSQDPRLAGAGVVQPVGATRTQAVALDDDGNAALSFGFEESTRDYNDSRELTVRNFGRDHVRFNVSYSPASPNTVVPHTVTFNRTSLSVEGNDSAELRVSIHVPVATVGATHDANFNDTFAEVAGYIVLTPVGASNSGTTLTVPYYLVPRARSRVDASLSDNFGPRHPNGQLRLSNRGGGISGTADFYAWGLSSPRQGDPYFDTRAVGVQSNLIGGGSDSVLYFAINTWSRFSNADAGEWDTYIDVNGDGQPDFVLYTADFGAAQGGSYNGTIVDVVVDLNQGTAFIEAFVDAPTYGSTLLLPVLASDIGVTPANPKFSYNTYYFNLLSGAAYAMPGTATFNAFSPSITNALFLTVPPGASGAVPVAIDPAQWASSPALGLMVVSQDNASGSSQAVLLRAGH
jgi:minor extracellular serine protease Vpr